MTELEAGEALRAGWKRARRTRTVANKGVKTGFVNPQSFTFRMRAVPGYALVPYDGMRVMRIQ